MKRLASKGTKISVVILILSVGFFSALVFAPVSHATGVAVVQAVAENFCSGTTTCTVSFGSPVTVGDVVIITTMFRFVTSGQSLSVTWPGSTGSVASIAGPVGMSGAACSGVSALCVFEYVFSTLEQSAGHSQYPVVGSTSGDFYTTAIEVSGLPSGYSVADAQNGACGSGSCKTPKTSSPTSFLPGGILVSGIGLYTATAVQGSGWSQGSGPQNTCGLATSAGRQCLQYLIPTSGGTTFYHGGSNDTAGFVDAGAFFGLAPTYTPYFVPCNFFQLQCWAYPMMFLGMFLGFFFGVAEAFGVSEKGFLFLLFAGATYGSLVEIQLGIMTPMVPLLLIVVAIGYSFRLDRVVIGAANAARSR